MEKDARVCPYCGYKMLYKGGTKLTRISDQGWYIRLRTCQKCNVTYKTYEIHEELFDKMNKLYSAVKAISE
jgi:DNA-directed RNA polymerase subunit RPC12/RpoP